MLQLRMAVRRDRFDALRQTLREIPGVRTVAGLEELGGETVLFADLDPDAADAVLERLRALGEDSGRYVLSRLDVVATSDGAAAPGFSWAEVLGEARANARPLARYLTFMAVAGVLAGLGVIDRNAILIIGAMAVSPDLLPVCAVAVGLVGRRGRLVARSSATLVLGLTLSAAVAAVMTALLDVTGLLADDFAIGRGGLGTLVTITYTTLLIPLAAGVAAMLAFQTRASAGVGVAISVTTIPAAAYLGVAVGVGEGGDALGAIGILAINVGLLLASATATLAVQRRAAQ
jgi:uncharacterized hydrophobic protein (TIGR00271 family)